MDPETIPVDNVDALVEADQSNDLLGYLRGQGFQAASATDDVANIDEASAPEEAAQTTDAQNAETAAVAQPDAGEQAAPGLTVADAEKQRYEATIADLSRQRDVDRTNLLIIAQQARAAEDARFEASLAQMDEEQQKIARAERKADLLQRERDSLLSERQQRQQRDDEAGKGIAAYKLVSALGLDLDDVDVLTTAETPQGMIAMAKGLAARKAAQPQTQQPAKPQVQMQNLVAGGENAPSAPPKRVEQRKGDLMGLFKERGYVNVATG